MGPLGKAFIGRKNVGVAYLLWFFFAYLGAHKFYLGRPLMGSLYIGLFILFVVGTAEQAREIIDTIRLSVENGTILDPYSPQPNIALLQVKYLGMVGLGLAYLYDLVTLPWQVDAANARAAANAQRDGGGAPTGSRRDDDGFFAEKADALIARYLAERAQAATQQPSKAGGAPTFGKRK